MTEFLNKKMLPLNLQMFADGEAEATNDEGVGSNEEDGETGFKPITDRSTFDSLTNKAVQSALAKQQKKFEADLQTRIDEALKKQKEYSQLSEEDRRTKELEDQKAKFEAEKAKFEYDKLLVQVMKDLSEKGLPTDVADIVAIKGDAEKSLENVTRLAKVIENAKAEERKLVIRQNDPGYGATGTSVQTNRGAELARKNKATTNSKPL